MKVSNDVRMFWTMLIVSFVTIGPGVTAIIVSGALAFALSVHLFGRRLGVIDVTNDRENPPVTAAWQCITAVFCLGVMLV